MNKLLLAGAARLARPETLTERIRQGRCPNFETGGDFQSPA
ncbi:MAG: hypothetical protein SNJ67_08410 [Chloracidobacterium sp.]|nr:hypothetical protein [Chloracidobacterium validum]